MKKSTNKPKKKPNNLGLNRRIKNRSFLTILAAEFILLIILIIPIISVCSSAEPIETSLSEWSSEKIKFKDGAWYADEKTVSTDDTIDLIYGPDIQLKKGSYLISVNYEATSEQTVTATAKYGQSSFIKTGTARLYKTLKTISFRVHATHDVSAFEVVVKYNGSGSLKITDIEIKNDYAGYGRAFAVIFLLIILGNLIYMYYDQLKENRTIVFALAGIVLLASIPLMYSGIGRGHDFDVHIMRIEGIAAELRRGVFPVRMSSDWIQGYGYPVSIYYGDLLLYIPALLRIAGFDVVMSYKIYIVFINAATAIISYYSFKGIFKDTRYGLLLSLVYSTATYRLMNLYIRSAVGEFSAAMFIPLIALALYRMYTEDTKNVREYRKNSLLLAVGMSGLICNHMLSTEMVVFVLVLLCLVMIKSTLRFETLKTFAIAVVQTILLSSFFIFPFLDYYTNVHTRINDRMNTGSSDMKQSNGVKLAELFSFFRDPFSEFSQSKNPRLIFTPGIVLMLALVVGVYLIVKLGFKKSGKDLTIYTVFSLFLFYVSSNIFPWDSFNRGDPQFGLILAQVQFQWRYIGISLIFLTLIVGCVLQIIEREKIGSPELYIQLAVVLCIISTASFTGQYLDDTHFVKYYNGADLNSSFVGMGEYILSDSSYRSIDGKLKKENVNSAEVSERNGCHIELDVENGDKEGSVTLPVFNYKGYTATDESGKKLEIADGDNVQIKVTIPSGYKGKITVDYKSPVSWRISELVSLISVIYFCFGKKLIKYIKHS